jgi:hypothetical protein
MLSANLGSIISRISPSVAPLPLAAAMSAQLAAAVEGRVGGVTCTTV